MVRIFKYQFRCSDEYTQLRNIAFVAEKSWASRGPPSFQAGELFWHVSLLKILRQLFNLETLVVYYRSSDDGSTTTELSFPEPVKKMILEVIANPHLPPRAQPLAAMKAPQVMTEEFEKALQYKNVY